MNVQELVAQTFDEGGNFAAISDRIGETTKAAPASAQTLELQGLTTDKGWLHE